MRILFLLHLILWPAFGFAGAVRIQTGPYSDGTSATFKASTQTGNTIVCIVAMYGSGSTTASVTDNSGANGTYSTALLWKGGTIGGGTVQGIFYKLNAASTTKVSLTTTGSGPLFSCYEYSGITGFDSGATGFKEVNNSGNIATVTMAQSPEIFFIGTWTLNYSSAKATSSYTVLDSSGGDNTYSIIARGSSFTGAVGTLGTPNTIDAVMAGFTTTEPTCSSPTGAAGRIEYDSTTHLLRYCDGSAWNPMNGSGTILTACTAADEGKFDFNGSVYRFCNGANWISMKGNSLGTCSSSSGLTYDTGTKKVKYCDGSTMWDTTTTSVTCNILLPSGSTSWTVPSDFNSANNKIYVVGGGGAGGKTTASAASGGGGGGAFSMAVNISLTPGASVKYKVGAGGVVNGAAAGDSYLCNSSSNCTSIADTAVIAGASAGGSSTGTAAGAGGTTTNGVGSIKYAGGKGHAALSSNTNGGAAGGAGGPNGPGEDAGSDSGGWGDDRYGGAGQAGWSPTTPDANGIEWDGTRGSGGGYGMIGSGGAGRAGGLYGGGGSGGGKAASGNGGANGAVGAILIQYLGTTCS